MTAYRCDVTYVQPVQVACRPTKVCLLLLKALSTRMQFLDKVILPFGDFAINSQNFFSCVACIFSLCKFSLAISPSDESYVKTHVPDKSLVKKLCKSFENNLAVF